MFLAKFFLSYVLLTAAYQYYLSGFDEKKFEVDDITKTVANQSVWLLEVFGSDASVTPHPSQPCVKLMYNGEFVARIVEGCNAISVIILFIAFVVAFSGKFRDTVLFILGGSLFVYFLNIGRIAFLASALYHYPQHEAFLHGVLFPLIIYSVVFLLWVIWVNRFSYVKNPARK